MIEQRADGIHRITLHQVRCVADDRGDDHSLGTGELTWSPGEGGRVRLRFDEGALAAYLRIVDAPSGSPGVGRFSRRRESPDWVAVTDDGTCVQLYETHGQWSQQVGERSYPTAEFSTPTGNTCTLTASFMHAVVEIPAEQELAFDNNTAEPFRLFFRGGTILRPERTEDVSFTYADGSRVENCRCSTSIQSAPRVALVSATPLVRCAGGSWLASETPPPGNDLSFGYGCERTFLSFLHGCRTPIFWSDRRLDTGVIRRTYFGWVRDTRDDVHFDTAQSLPLFDETSDDCSRCVEALPQLFRGFQDRWECFPLAFILSPLWRAIDGLLEDRLALASVALERLSTAWANRPDRSREEENTGLSTAERRKLGRALRSAVSDALTQFEESSGSHLGELREIATRRAENLLARTNRNALLQPFEDLGIELTEKDRDAINRRNDALHGRSEFSSDGSFEISELDESAQMFDHLRTLITRFVLRLCDYQGPYIDYASRPSEGNFTVRQV